MKKNYVLDNGQLAMVAEIRYALTHGILPHIPSRFHYLEELVNLEQVEDYCETGFNFLSSDAKEFDGILSVPWMYSDVMMKLPNPVHSVLNRIVEKIDIQLVTWKNAYITVTSPTFVGFIPTVNELNSWFCECGDEAADPGMGCLPCFTGVKDLIEEDDYCIMEAMEHSFNDTEESFLDFDEHEPQEGPYGGAFADDKDFARHVGIHLHD